MNFNLGPILWMAAIGATLGVWKAIEIIVWVCRHIHWE